MNSIAQHNKVEYSSPIRVTKYNKAKYKPNMWQRLHKALQGKQLRICRALGHNVVVKKTFYNHFLVLTSVCVTCGK